MPKRLPETGMVLSVVTHGVVLAGLVWAASRVGPAVRAVRMPGTPQGNRLMLTYNLGGPAAPAPSPMAVARVTKPAHAAAVKPSAVPSPAPAATVAGTTGKAQGGDSALGDENLRIALPQVHPRPQPDLSSLPHGTAGDVVVDVTIDETGKVVGTTLVKGLGGGVDATVMATLRGWVFTPANRDGQNVASEQEILIHYEHA